MRNKGYTSFFFFACNEVDRLSINKKRCRDFSLLWIPQMPRLSIGITRAIFHIYLSVTHCPLIRQQASKMKKAFCRAVSFVCVRETDGQSSLMPSRGVGKSRPGGNNTRKTRRKKISPLKKGGKKGQRLVHEVTICQWGEKFNVPNGEIYIDLFSTTCMNTPCGLTPVWPCGGRQ